MNEEEKTELENEVEKAADAAEEPEKKQPFGRRAASSLYDIVEMIGVITVVIILCFSFVVRLNIVDGGSMEQTLRNGEYLVVSDLFYKPKTGDIVVLQSPVAGENLKKPLVKRVIATGGQTIDIDIETGAVSVDGVRLDEDYVFLDHPNISPYGNISSMTVRDGHATLKVDEGFVFVMGDHRDNSSDSRLAAIGQIDERCIVGKVLFRIYPFNSITAFKNPFDGK